MEIQKFDIRGTCLQRYNGTDTCVTVPDGITEIGWGAFSGNTSLSEIILPESLVKIDDHAFSGCTSLTSVVLPDGVTTIPRGAFEGCTSLREIILPDGVKSIVDFAFSGCSSLTKVMIPSTTEFIWYCAFGGCTSLVEVVIPDGVKLISTNAFKDCTSLQTLVISDSVRDIKENAFRGCTALKNVILPQDLIEVEKNAFLGCAFNVPESWLNEYGFPWFRERFGEENAYLIALISNVPTSKLFKYAAKNPKCVFDQILKQNRPDLVPAFLSFWKTPDVDVFAEYISIATEKNATEITAVLVDRKAKTFSTPDLEKIEQEKIEKDFGFKKRTVADWKKIFDFKSENGSICINKYKGTDPVVVIPDKIGNAPVLEIGFRSFFGCSFLTEVILPDGILEFHSDVFEGCDSLQFNEYDGLRYLGNSENPYQVLIGPVSNSIQEAHVHECCTVIAGGAFGSCKALKRAWVSSAVRALPDFCFSRCDSLTEVVLSENVKKIGMFSFFDCRALTKINIPDGVSEIGCHTFMGCSSLTELVLPGSVKVIGDEAFKNCKSLQKIVIPESVEKIDTKAFAGKGKKLTIYGAEGSFAEDFALSKNIRFETI